jgi:hypothetical protein
MNYAQTISRNFTAAFLSALPRELRDHVYTYFWDDEDIVRQMKRFVREYVWSYRVPEFCVLTYVQPAHIGGIVAEELALSTYKKAFKTNLHVTISAGHAHKVLAANTLRNNLKLADCIRALDIEWYLNKYSDKDVARSFQDLSKYNFPNLIPVEIILGKFPEGIEGIAEASDVLANEIKVFKPAYNALVRGSCPVTIDSPYEIDVQAMFFSGS